MSIALVSNVGGASSVSVSDISPKQAEVQSLDDKLREMFASSSASTQAAYNGIMADVNNPAYVSAPGALVDLQVRLGEYRHEVETISALTRKGVSMVETLLRS